MLAGMLPYYTDLTPQPSKLIGFYVTFNHRLTLPKHFLQLKRRDLLCYKKHEQDLQIRTEYTVRYQSNKEHVNTVPDNSLALSDFSPCTSQ